MNADEKEVFRNEKTSSLSLSWLIGALLALVPVCIALYYLFAWEPEQVSQPETTNSTIETPIPQVPETELISPPTLSTEISTTEPELSEEPIVSEPILPELDESNESVVNALASLSVVDGWLKWVSTDEALRKFVVVIDNIADGKVARKYISIPKPKQKFKINEKERREYLKPENYQRYNKYIDIFDAIDTELTATTYRQFSPLLEQAFGELGYPDKTFHSTLLRAIDVILNAPIIQDEIELTHTSVLYKYADPKLEKLPDIHKQILRMGPRNTAIAQRKLTELKKALAK